jgi:hypothetical protein
MDVALASHLLTNVLAAKAEKFETAAKATATTAPPEPAPAKAVATPTPVAAPAPADTAIVEIPEMELTDNQIRGLTSTVPFLFYTTKRPLYTVSWYIGQIVGLVLGMYAAFLSWSCNAGLDHSIGMRIIYALFAFAFGGLYLVMYAIMRYDTCPKTHPPFQQTPFQFNPVGAPPRFFQ